MLLSNHGKLLVSGSDDKTIILWDLENQNSEILGNWKDRHTGSISALALTLVTKNFELAEVPIKQSKFGRYIHPMNLILFMVIVE